MFYYVWVVWRVRTQWKYLRLVLIYPLLRYVLLINNTDKQAPILYVELMYMKLRTSRFLLQAPEDDFFSVHIRIAGDWTGKALL